MIDNNNFNPKVSIIIPVYNGSNYIGEAIDSAINQTYKNIEIIVINDGSNDNGKTRKIALSFGDKIRYFEKENGGVATALNLGIKKMTGEYFSWLSHDDVYYPEKIDYQIEQLRAFNNKYLILYSDFVVINEKSNIINTIKLDNLNPDDFRYSITINNLINGCTLLIPKKSFDEVGVFNETLRTTQDYDLWFRMASKYKFIHNDRILVKSRIHSTQGTKRMNNLSLKECDDLMIHFINYLSSDELIRASNTVVSKAYYILYKSFKQRNFKNAASYALLKSLVTCKSIIKMIYYFFLILKEFYDK